MPLVQLANWWCRFLCLLAMAGSRGHLTMAHLCVSRLSLSAAGRGAATVKLLLWCWLALSAAAAAPTAHRCAHAPFASSARRTAPGHQRTRKPRSTSSRATCRFFIGTLGYLQNRYIHNFGRMAPKSRSGRREGERPKKVAENFANTLH